MYVFEIYVLIFERSLRVRIHGVRDTIAEYRYISIVAVLSSLYSLACAHKARART